MQTAADYLFRVTWGAGQSGTWLSMPYLWDRVQRYLYLHASYEKEPLITGRRHTI